MNKLNLYIAALALSMTACSQEELVNENAMHEYTLDAEIVQEAGDNSRVNIGATETNENGKLFSRVNWENEDTFCAFNANTKKVEEAIVFKHTLKEGESEHFKASFTTATTFAEADIPYAVYPKKRFKGIKQLKTGTRVMLGLPSELLMSESQDAVMIGKYNTDTKIMKFNQTMGMLEIVFPASLEADACLKIEANRPINAAPSKARIDVVDDGKSATGKVEILEGTNAITLYNNGYKSNKVYCAVPAATDYTKITVTKGTYTKEEVDNKTIYTPTFEAAPIKTVSVKAPAEAFTIKTRLYTIDCTK